MKIAVMSDLHYPSSEGVRIKLKNHVISERDNFYNDYLKKFFSEEADLYVSLGDLTNYGKEDELKEVYEIIRSHDKPFKHVLGNHDRYTLSHEEINQITGMQGDSVVDMDEAVLVFLETARELDSNQYDGWLTDTQLDWLEGVIDESGEKVMLIFAHHPLHDTTARSNKKMLSIHPSIEIWDVLYRKKGRGFYINGHTHTDSIVEKGNWSFIQASAVLDSQSARIIEIDKDFLDVRAVELSTEKSGNQAAVIGEALEHFVLFSEGVGTTLNRNKRFDLRITRKESVK